MGNFAVNLKHEVSHINLTDLEIPPPIVIMGHSTNIHQQNSSNPILHLIRTKLNNQPKGIKTEV